jgi:CheY-like chemotaxis protein/anti-sigma regulatory factor (Ser/Thr protein kinase)
MFRLQAAAKGIEFRFQAALNLPHYVHTDQKRLRQILINLLSNAVKYTENGHAGLAVRYRSQVAEFEITDTGLGIPAEDLERVFEPFERGRSPSIRSVPGTGLGLTITKLLTHIMGGEVLVRSTPGEGTTFVVRLQLTEASHTGAEIVRPRRARGYKGPRRKILLADDDPAHLELLQRLLEPLDFTLLAGWDGSSCLQLAALHGGVDLAFLDISMPDMTGWEAARKLREMPTAQDLKIVMVSANAHEYTPGGDGGHLHDAFLVKPIDIELLLESLGSLLRLEWIYDPVPVALTETSATAGVPAADCGHHIDELYQLGRIGHVRGIDAKLKEIEAENPANGPFAAHLRGLVSNFELKRYMHVLEAIRKQG